MTARSPHPVSLVRPVVFAPAVAFLGGCAARLAGGAPGRAATSYVEPLVVEHATPVAVHLRAGDTLAIRPVLRNAAAGPVQITYGARLFVLEGTRVEPRRAARPADPVSFPAHASWGEVRSWEYPNPRAVYTADETQRVLAPGERLAAAGPLFPDGFRVAFDSAGQYRVRVCAALVEVRLCSRRPILVSIE